MTSLKDILYNLKSYALTGEDVLNLANGKAHVMDYRDLRTYDDIFDAMNGTGALILLYESSLNYGHWVCVIDRGNNILEHFDSYGLKPDDEINFTSEDMREFLGEDYPHLSVLLYNSNCKIEYNQFKLQSKKKGINTCGRWTGMRIIFKNLSIENFAKLFIDDFYTTDDMVVLFSIFFL